MKNVKVIVSALRFETLCLDRYAGALLFLVLSKNLDKLNATQMPITKYFGRKTAHWVKQKTAH